MTEADPGTEIETLVVGPAMAHRIAHREQRAGVDPFARVAAGGSTNAAHEVRFFPFP
jgi:hypothetical protein